MPENNGRMLRVFIPLGLVVGLLFTGCNHAPIVELPYQTIEGEAQGSYYRITYGDTLSRNLQPEVTAILREMDAQVSTYLDTSLISSFNRYQGLDFPVSVKSVHFLNNYLKSREIFRESNGAFDPTVMPLVSYWGFGIKPHQVQKVDTMRVDSLRQLVGLTRIMMIPKGRDSVILRKEVPGVQLDFNAIAQGYTVDRVAEMLRSKGIYNYLVDIGGEVIASGVNPRGKTWTIGINTPSESGKVDELFATVPLQNKALATSGNYRKYYEVKGVKYSHTINPHTGFPERNALLSASVFAPDAATADGLATACMVLGPEAGMALINRNENVEAYFIVGKSDGTMGVVVSKGLQHLLRQ